MEKIYIYLAVKLIQKSGLLKKLKVLAKKTKSPVDNKIITRITQAVDLADLLFIQGKSVSELANKSLEKLNENMEVNKNDPTGDI